MCQCLKASSMKIARWWWCTTYGKSVWLYWYRIIVFKYGVTTHLTEQNSFIMLKLPSLFTACLFWTFHTKSHTRKLLNNGHPFCRGLGAVVDECPLVRGCGKTSTNPRVWRGQGRLIYTKSVPRSFRPTKKWTDLQDRVYQCIISACLSSRPPWSFIS